MSWDKIGTEGKLLSWTEVMEVEEYEYTAGVAGEEFLKKLEERKILSSRCPRCGKVYVPARLYCEDCFVRAEFKELDEKGENKPYLDTYTIVYADDNGNKLEKPQIIGLVRFKGTIGGLLAFIDGEPRIGSEVEILQYTIPLLVKVK